MKPYGPPLILFGTAILLPTLSALIGAMVVWPPGDPSLPWPERARRCFPARLGPVINVFVLFQITAAVLAIEVDAFRLRVSTQWLVAACISSLIGPTAVAVLLSWRASRRQRPLQRWIVGIFSALLFRFPNTVVYALLAAALFVVHRDLFTVAFLLLLGGLAMAFFAWGGGVLMAQWVGLARPALPRSEHAAEWAAERVGIRPTATYEIIWPAVRVDAFVFSRFLVFTDAAADLLSDQELFALSIREITFFRQRWLAGSVRAADSALIFIMLAGCAIGTTLGGNAMLYGAIIGVIGALAMRPFVRRAQLKADALAADAAIDPVSALKAMERQFELNLQPMVAVSRQSPNAHLYDRMARAGIPPAYPRPRPPSKGRIIACVVTASAAMVILGIGVLINGAILTANFL